jgi:hypothetical protein
MDKAAALGIGIITMSFVAQAQAGTPPSIDDNICLTCEDVVPAWLRDKHFGGKDAKPLNHNQCKASCAFDSKPITTVVVYCGRSDEVERTRKPVGTTKPIPDLEDNGYSLPFNGELIVQYTDKDTPCSVILHADPKDPTSEAKAIALGRDVAKALTPEVVAKRKSVEAIVWAQDKTGQKAQAALESWEKEAAAMKDLGTFSSGFPKVIDHKDKPGLPEGEKSLLLGYCVNGNAANIVKFFKGALPGLAWYRVPAERLTLACPAATYDYGDASLVSKKAKVGKDDLSVLAFVADRPMAKDQSGPRRNFMSVQAYLRDKSGRLLASQRQEVSGSGDIFNLPKIKTSEGGLTVQVVLDMGKHPSCKTRPTYIVTEQVAVVDGKITITEDEGAKPSCACCEGE